MKDQFAEVVRQPEIQECIVKWVESGLAGNNDQLCAVTLTFKPGYKFIEGLRSIDVKQFLKRLNTKVYGKSYKHGIERLKCFPVFENNLHEGLHVHMFLGIPINSFRLDARFEDVVLSEWLKMDCAGIIAAQDVRACNDCGGWANYITKKITNGNAAIKLDAENIFFG